MHNTLLDPRELLALPLDIAVARAEAAGKAVQVVPYAPPREGTPEIAERAAWRVAKAQAGEAAGSLILVAVRAQ